VWTQLFADETSAFADPADPNYTDLHSLPDLDALVELQGHNRAEDLRMDVYIRPLLTSLRTTFLPPGPARRHLLVTLEPAGQSPGIHESGDESQRRWQLPKRVHAL
jgi:hypothetical protein